MVALVTMKKARFNVHDHNLNIKENMLNKNINNFFLTDQRVNIYISSIWLALAEL